MTAAPLPASPPPPSSEPPQRRRGGWVAGLATALILAGAAAGSWFGAAEAARQIEARSAGAVRAALAGRQGWARIEASGLQLILTGTAPDEGARLRVMAEAGRVVDPGRIVDRMEVAPRTPAAPPAFKVELLRNDAGLSIIGLVPGEEARRRLAAQMAAIPGKPAVTDLLESAAYDPPARWDSALRFGAGVIGQLPRAKISVAPGVVAVTAIADSPRDKTRIEAMLRRQKPADVTLTMAITAPRPVITPFTLRFVKDAEGARFDACAVESDEARRRVQAAGVAAGAPEGGECTLGLGAPSPQWPDAVIAAIGTVGSLGAGAVTFTDASVSLDVPSSVSQEAFDTAVAGLEASLPPAYRLAATREAPASAQTTPDSASFTASRAADGRLTLRGRVADARMRNVVESFARARFDTVETAGLAVDPAVPEGWTLRLIGALEALQGLSTGSAEVTPQIVRIAGVSGSSTASDAAAVTLGRRLGAGADYRLAIRYDRRQDPTLGLPDGQQCVDRANQVMATSEIGFEPAKADIAGDMAPTIAALKAALTDCEAFRIEIGGHTDSQGSDDFNQKLSLGRAGAVLAALGEAGIDNRLMTAAGYGESQPVATNDTEAGREANRRIEFRLLSPEPVEAAAAPAPVVTGVTAGSAGAADPLEAAAAPDPRDAATGTALAVVTATAPAVSAAAVGAASGTALAVLGDTPAELRAPVAEPPAELVHAATGTALAVVRGEPSPSAAWALPATDAPAALSAAGAAADAFVGPAPPAPAEHPAALPADAFIGPMQPPPWAKTDEPPVAEVPATAFIGPMQAPAWALPARSGLPSAGVPPEAFAGPDQPATGAAPSLSAPSLAVPEPQLAVSPPEGYTAAQPAEPPKGAPPADAPAVPD